MWSKVGRKLRGSEEGQGGYRRGRGCLLTTAVVGGVSLGKWLGSVATGRIRFPVGEQVEGGESSRNDRATGGAAGKAIKRPQGDADGRGGGEGGGRPWEGRGRAGAMVVGGLE